MRGTHKGFMGSGMTGGGGMLVGRGMRNPKDRVSTANGVVRRKTKIEMPASMMQHTDSKIDLLYERLKQCQGDGGIVDPMQALKTMNMVQIEENPDAYVPNIEK